MKDEQFYYKCENCGHLNNVKTEFLIFCSECNKKLKNSFQDLKKTTDISFDTYKKEFCLTSSQINNEYIDKIRVNQQHKLGIIEIIFLPFLILLNIIFSYLIILGFANQIPAGHEMGGLGQYFLTLIFVGFVNFINIIVIITTFIGQHSIRTPIISSIINLIITIIISFIICI